jgi:hypothetical protein
LSRRFQGAIQLMTGGRSPFKCSGAASAGDSPRDF